MTDKIRELLLKFAKKSYEYGRKNFGLAVCIGMREDLEEQLNSLFLTEEEIEKIIMETQAYILINHQVPATNKDLATAIFKAQEEKRK